MDQFLFCNTACPWPYTLSLHDALPISVTGMLVAGLALLSVAVYYAVLTTQLGLEPGSREVIDALVALGFGASLDRKSTRLNSSHVRISYAVFCLKKKKITRHQAAHILS